MEPNEKKVKLEVENTTCKHYVLRKKRNCKMTVSKGKEYCGEHEPADSEITTNKTEHGDRIPCPLDPKHTVYKKNLHKHLKICNAKPKENLPAYIQTGVNAGSDNESELDVESCYKNLKLTDVTPEELGKLIAKVEILFDRYIKDQIPEIICSHDILSDELANTTYGQETRKHLVQSAAILGMMQNFDLLKSNTSYIEFGAGKGQLSYWLANVLQNQKKSQIVLLDRASLRHKKDNKLEDRSAVHRIRADIADFNMNNLDILKTTESVVGISKHLCGAATDLTLRCILQGNCTSQTESFIIAVCCHHRCEWKSFVGKKFFESNLLSRKDFLLITKMASYAICGTGLSRERRKMLEQKIPSENIPSNDSKTHLTPERREEVGKMCKRLLDYSRVIYMTKNGFDCSLKFYVKNSVTLENVCIVGHRKIGNKV